ncbi:hypothetical protein L2747_18765 [Shewanella marinintestina]|uniref:hypothetical protein n=1 Tax=Shewanella marinintestina TaxID=190305 RepID=UPI002010B230|nr:hypothetical protein [Shewanella marinintestina]MCL1148049.1 hypothetical protein [Shewanella marinintestina]
MKRLILATLVTCSTLPAIAADIETDAYRASIAYLCAEKMTLAGERKAASEFRADGQNYIALYTNQFSEFKAALRKHKSKARSYATELKCRSIAGI